MTTTHYTLPRDGDRDVTFRGIHLASASSRDCDSSRWTEIDIYRTEGRSYVVAKTGVTCWRGEFNRHAVVICDTPEKVLAALYTDTRDWDGRRYLTHVAREALKDAAEADQALAPYVVETVA